MAAPGKLTIETPEQIALEFSLASIGSRFLALAIDTGIQAAGFLALAIVAIIGAVALPPLSPGAELWVFGGALLLAFALYFGYFTCFEIIWAGQTIGKRMIGLRVIHATGRPATAFELILRNVLRIADQLPAFYAFGIVCVFATDKNQRLGDLAAGTVVVHEQPVEVAVQEPVPEVTVMGPAHGATRLTPEEIAVTEAFLRRRADLPGYQRVRLARELAMRLRQRLAITTISENERFLEEIVGEYRAAGRYR